MSSGADSVKPELFSVIFMFLTVFNWWLIKTGDDKSWKKCYLFPLIFLVWVNSHGGFISGATFIGLVFTGEILNILFAQQNSLPVKVRKHFFYSIFLCIVSVFITPYGFWYIIDLFKAMLTVDTAQLGTIMGYSVTYKIPIFRLVESYGDFFIVAVAILLFIISFMVKSGRITYLMDFTIILPFLAFSYFYLIITRMTFFLAPVFAFISLFLLSRVSPEIYSLRNKRVVGIVSILIFLALSGRSIFNSIWLSGQGRWFGLGLNYYHPVEEAQYIKKFIPVNRICNSYNQGSYLLWILWPQKKIMIDTRYFPFTKWYDVYIQFAMGKYTERFARDFKCKAWCLEYKTGDKIIDWFLSSPDWKLSFYGPSAVVFAKRDLVIKDDGKQFSERIFNIRSITQALLVLDFCTDIGQWENGRKILKSISKNLRNFINKKAIEMASDYFNGKYAYYRRDYTAAIEFLDRCKNKQMRSNTLLAFSYYHLAVDQWTEENDKQALQMVQKALQVEPDDLYGLYNRAVINWWLSHRDGSDNSGQEAVEMNRSDDNGKFKSNAWWRDLRDFIKQTEKMPEAREAVLIAQRLLNGDYPKSKRPPLLYPPEPPLLKE